MAIRRPSPDEWSCFTAPTARFSHSCCVQCKGRKANKCPRFPLLRGKRGRFCVLTAPHGTLMIAANSIVEDRAMTKEEKRILAGQLFAPGDQELRALKLRAHNLCGAYNQTFEDETDKREKIVRELFEEFGEDAFCQGPIFIHYGSHTRIGKRLFANFNLTIQDDG
ncbi:MAG: hypothetical protein EOM69_08240, partial [Clostridia bacterium]|nr:hypothetical protein [Clostridia bacterium]